MKKKSMIRRKLKAKVKIKKTKKVSQKQTAKPKSQTAKHARKIWITSEKFAFLNNKLQEAQETLDAIRTGVVDAVVISGPQGNQVYSLTGAEQPYRVYVEQMQEGAVTVSSDAMILYCNQRFANMLKIPLERVISTNLSSYLDPACWEKLSTIFNSEGKVVKYESPLHCPGGIDLPVHLTASRLPMENHEVMCLVVTDITEQREKAELRLAKEVAEKANAAKDAFLAALSHELRTPLNPVLLLASEGANNADLPASIRSDFASIRDNIELEARLIDDLLDLTRIAHGKLTMEMKPLNPHSILQQAIHTVRPELDLKRITLTLALHTEDCAMQGDAIRLQQVFWNILRNAIKFTPERGTIAITSRMESAKELTVTVSDSGIGMTQEELKRIFETFVQGEHATSSAHRFGGLGLGLAISRRLVELHSGTIRAFSDGLNLGATFVIRLPLVKQLKPVSQPVKNLDDQSGSFPVSANAIQVLLVEDHEPTRTTLARLLIRRNYQVTTASSLGEALALAKQNQFQIVISDIGLPDGNGFDLMKELHKTQNLKGIALTGYGMNHDVERSLAAGFSAHLTKPIRVQALESALSRLLVLETA